MDNACMRYCPLKQSCLVMEPAGRLTCEELLDHSYFDDDFKEKFEPELEVLCVHISKMYVHAKFIVKIVSRQKC